MNDGELEIIQFVHNDAAPLPNAHNDAANLANAHQPNAANVLAHNQRAAMSNPRLRFRVYGKKIVRLLRLRRVWSSMGSWLNTAASHRSRRRILIASIWRELSVTIRRYAALFRHLHRIRGQLCYRH